MPDRARRETDALLDALKAHDRNVAAPMRQAYAEEREALVRENRHKELAVFDALEDLRDVERSCSDEYAASRIREVIDDLEAVF